MCRPLLLRPALVAGALLAAACGVSAQTQPTPGPTKPPPVAAQPGQPTPDTAQGPSAEQCRAGWHPGLVWTKEQFEMRCGQQKAQK
jgi:hypothetical protein